jgi:hypothetical protein
MPIIQGFLSLLGKLLLEASSDCLMVVLNNLLKSLNMCHLLLRHMIYGLVKLKKDYISVVAHFVNSDWCLEKRLLGLRPIEVAHTGLNIVECVEMVARIGSWLTNTSSILWTRKATFEAMYLDDEQRVSRGSKRKEQGRGGGGGDKRKEAAPRSSRSKQP